MPWGWSNYLVGAAAPDLSLVKYCTATAVSCIPYNLMLIVAGAGLRDIALMDAEDFSPKSIGVGFWVVASIGAAVGLAASSSGIVHLRRLLREEVEAEKREEQQDDCLSPTNADANKVAWPHDDELPKS